jgi:hypothetical protein
VRDGRDRGVSPKNFGSIRRDCLHPPGSVFASRRDLSRDTGSQHAFEPQSIGSLRRDRCTEAWNAIAT